MKSSNKHKYKYDLFLNKILILKFFVDLLPDFYAVNVNGNGYKVFSRVGNCKAYFQSGEQIILYQYGDRLKIANLKSGNLECQNIGYMIDSSLPPYETTGELPSEESDKTYTLTTTPFNQKMTIEIEILKKCEKKIGFKIIKPSGKQQESVSREQCESRDYWNKNYPNQYLIVSFSENKCNFADIKKVILVKNSERKPFFHSSSCH